MAQGTDNALEPAMPVAFFQGLRAMATSEQFQTERAALNRRSRIVAEVSKLAQRATDPGLAARLAVIAATEREAIRADREALIAAVRAEMVARFHRRFLLTRAAQRELASCQHGPEFRSLWQRLEHRPSAKPMPAMVIRVRPPGRARCRQRPRPRAASVGSTASAEPDPDPVLGRFEKTRAWTLLPPPERRRVIGLLRSGSPGAAVLIGDIFTAAALARDENPGHGDLWIGPELPVNAVLVRDRGGLWRILQFRSDAPHAWVTRGQA